ncbi:MAG: anthranilate synthase component I [Rhodospirillaceae bacterium]|jgi:anthranilate synthase component I|nr:anthranilate synthase component I [Rhodospirillaceae bacterium]
MQTSPDYDDFTTAYDAGRAQVIWTTAVADLETPVSAMMKLSNGRPNSFLLESVQGGSVRGRYSFIGLKPDLIWRCDGDEASLNRRALSGGAFTPCSSGSLESLRALIEESRIDLPESLPPMAAGLFGYMSYDMVRLMEKLPDNNPDVLGTPDGLFLRPTVIAVFDTIEDIVTIVTPVRPAEGVDAAAAHRIAEERLADVLADLERPLPYHGRTPEVDHVAPTPTSNMTRPAFHEMVKRGKEYIQAGDVFQVVLSQRFELPFTLPPFSLYRSLRRLNPSPFLFFLDFGDFAIVGSSPEILVRLRGDEVTIRPVAGTRPRGATPEEDKAYAEDLLADPKERAEHLMLLDLGRNDVGRVSQIGTVKVTEQYVIENYSHVMHISSNVVGKIAPEYDALSALIAGFPAGTVSGAPKVRAMEIVDELESERRGIYSGCIGYFGAGGDMDTCISLRTSVVKDGKMYVQAGGGIVADSDPEMECQESENKARALIRAAQEAVDFASYNRRS